MDSMILGFHRDNKMKPNFGINLTLSSFILLLSFIHLQAFASFEKSEINSFNEVALRLETLLKKYKASEIQVVFDIDNTLLAPNQNLNSDQWFEWQMKQQTGDLFKVQTDFFQIGKMHPPEPEGPAIIDQIKSKKVTPVILTSRGYDLMFPTLRELNRNYPGLVDAEKLFYMNCFVPYHANDLKKFGFSKKETDVLAIKESRTACYFENLILSSGNTKPLTLLAYNQLKKLKPKVVIFVDDRAYHMDDFAKYTTKQKTVFFGLRYGKEDENVKQFSTSEKTVEGAQLKKYLDLKSEIFK